MRFVYAAFSRPLSANRLALLRIVLGSFLLSQLWLHFGEYQHYASSIYHHVEPVGLMHFVSIESFSVYAVAFHYVTLTLGLCWVAGIAWRGTGPIFAICSTLWLSYFLSFGSITHAFHLLILHVLAVGFAPAAAVLSLDSLLSKRWSSWPLWSPGPISLSAHYGWAVQLCCSCTVLVYFISGLTKLQYSGLSWTSGQNLYDQITYSVLLQKVYQPGLETNSMVEWCLQYPRVLSAFAVISLAVELAAPLALLHRRLFLLWGGGVMGMHVGIAILMGITFPYQTYGVMLLPFVLIFFKGSSTKSTN